MENKDINFEKALMMIMAQSLMSDKSSDSNVFMKTFVKEFLGNSASEEQMLPAESESQEANLKSILLGSFLKHFDKKDAVSESTEPALGQVNGALGKTIGNLLNGRKTAIGLIGSIVTSIFGNEKASTALEPIVSQVLPAVLQGSSGVFLPLFIGMAIWGSLGKMEKWSGIAR